MAWVAREHSADHQGEELDEGLRSCLTIEERRWFLCLEEDEAV
jgi:hypothetical protein